MELITAPGFAKGVTKHIPIFLTLGTDLFILLAFVAIFIYAVFWPSFISVLWLVIIFVASFNSLPIVKRLFFPFLAVTFTLSLVVLTMTQATDFEFMSVPDHTDLLFLQLLGFFKYEGQEALTFGIGGCMIVVALGQIGRICVAKQNHKSFNVQEPSEIDETELQLTIRNTRTTIRFESMKQLFNEIWKICRKRLTFICYLLLCISIVLSILVGFYLHRFAFQVLAVLILTMVFLSHYKRPVFEILRFLTGILIMTCAFSRALVIPACQNDDSCVWFAQFEMRDETGLRPPLDTSLIGYVWGLTLIFCFNTFFSHFANFFWIEMHQEARSSLFLLVAFCQFVLVYAFDLTIFALFYWLIGLATVMAQILRLARLQWVALLAPNITIAVYLCLYLVIHIAVMKTFGVVYIGVFGM
jgi:hypothetical protein